MNKTTYYSTFLLVVSSAASIIAQPPGGGGPPWGGGGPGGPMGGPGMMMGGPMGGPGMMMGGPGGGWGGRGGRGGEGGGGMGGMGGGFDPSQFLTRMDTNGNGSLDPDEAQGPARFMLERMARDNPKIDLTKPIPMSTLTEAFQRMRGGGPGGGGPGGVSDEEILEPENNSLVPGFSTKQEKIPVPGFGASGEKFSVKIDERDLKEADDRIKRYDKNSDQALDENEMKEGRWNDSPMQYDRNRDGKLSRQELATRQARRRTLKSDQQDPKNKKEQALAKTRETGEEKKEAKPNPFEKIASYRVTDAEGRAVRPAGLPEWFSKNDINFDNQVSMKEFSKKWTTDSIEDFQRFDSNQDGFITSKECLVAVKKGYIPGASTSSASSSSDDSNSTASSGASAAPATGATTAPAKASSSGDGRMRAFAERAVKKADKDNNGFLSPEEFKEGDFAKVDTNKDGKIDIDEYVVYRTSR